jgi:hypothetical protein
MTQAAKGKNTGEKTASLSAHSEMKVQLSQSV